MKPVGSMMKPEPSELTWRGRGRPGPRKSLNRSDSGEPGGRLGRPDTLAAGFSVWLVAMLTTVGRSCAERSAKLAGAPRTGTGCGATVVTGLAAGAASADRGRIAARRMLAGL